MALLPLHYHAPGPPLEKETFFPVACKSACGRAVCMASAAGFSDYCCVGCAQGQGHSEKCDTNAANFEKLRVK
jgi:hypothetical protein